MAGRPMDKVSPCLWFNFQAEEAVTFYLATFGQGRVLQVSRYGDHPPGHQGQVLVMTFELFGRTWQALNGGPQFPFTEAVSMSVQCADQAELDRLWAALTSGGGQPGRCGWLKDRFGLSWQLVPEALPRLMADPARAERVMQRLLTMDKIDIAALEAA